MASELVLRLITNPSSASLDDFFADTTSVFWVDWRADDGEIAGSCESILRTGQLTASWEDERLTISFGERQIEVPLTDSPQDRHITLLALNDVLRPDYEARMAWASHGTDTAGMVPLSAGEWNDLESRFGPEAVSRAFLRLTAKPNIFTDSLRPPRSKPWWRFW